MTAPVVKNEYLEVTIEDLTYAGMGVAKIQGYPLFIAQALPGEACQIKVVKVLKNYGFAILIKRYTDSPERADVLPARDNMLKTGTLPLAHLKYSAQLSFKAKQVKNCLHKEGLSEQIQVLESLGMADPWHYRNKAQVPIAGSKGNLYTGFYRQNSHDILSVSNYYIQLPQIDETLEKAIEILRQFPIDAYDESRHQGLLRHLVVRVGYYTQEMQLILVINGENLPQEKQIVEKLKAALPHLVSLVLNINQRKDNVILGDRERVLSGQAYYHDQLFNQRFAISAHSFFQVNTLQAEVLYEQVRKRAALTGQEIVLDAYCGLGTIGASLAPKAQQVYGVEVVPEAIALAKENAKANGLDNMTFVAKDASQQLATWQAEGVHFDVAVVDPPRKGLAESFIQSLCELAPAKIIYVSCNPATLARDLKALLANGYEAGDLQPVDMFPQTTHVETIALIQKM